MDCFPSNHDWMYNRKYSGRGALKESFVTRVEEFVSKAHQQDYYNSDGDIRCPCVKCDFTKILRDEIVFTFTKLGSYLIIGFEPIMVSRHYILTIIAWELQAAL